MFSPVFAGLRVLGWLGAVWLCLGDAVSLVPTATSSWKLLVVCGSVPSLLGTLLPVPTATSSPPALLFATRLQRPQKLHPSRSTSTIITASLERSPWRPLPGEGPGGVGNQPLAVCRAFGACGWARTFSGAVKPEIAPVVFPWDPKQSSARARNGRCRPWPLARGCRISGDRQDLSAPVSRKQEDGNRQLLRKRFGDGGRDAATTWGGTSCGASPGNSPSSRAQGAGVLGKAFWGDFACVFQSWFCNEQGETSPRSRPWVFLGLLRRPCFEEDRGTSWLAAPRTDPRRGVTAKPVPCEAGAGGIALRVPREAAPRSSARAPVCKHLLCDCRSVSCSAGRHGTRESLQSE